MNYTDEDASASLDFVAAEARMEKLKQDAHWRAIRLGMRDSASVTEDPALQESIAKQALLEQYLGKQERPAPKGPARRARPKVDPKKAQRRARKRSR